jgi:rod shape determining protein RodA
MKSWRLDWQLLLPVLIIFLLGLACLGSISPSLAVSQLLFFLIGAGMFFLFSQLHYSAHQGLTQVYALGIVIFLLLPFIFGMVTRGSIRWLQLGPLTLQPSELIKPFLILGFAGFLCQPNRFSQGTKLLVYFLCLLLPAFLIFKQPDLGSTLVVIAIWFFLLLAAEFPWKYLLTFFLLLLLSLPLIWKILAPYQQQRIFTFLNPYADPQGAGYHLLQSIIAIGSGGLWGRGLGRGVQSQLRFLPESHSDFIFASLAEELGFLGAICLILVYFLLLKRILEIAKNAPDRFSQFISLGVFAMLFFQATVNIAMNLGLLPITGVTLPLVSSGGSSLLATMISLGIIHNISLNSRRQPTLEIK